MKRLFGTAKAQPKAAPAPSLQETSTRIDSRVSDLEAKIAKCDQDVRRHMQRGPQAKPLAMQSLQRKKMYEQQLQQLLGTQFNIDSLAGAQEQADLAVVTVEAMKAGTQDLRERYSKFAGIGDVDKLMDSMADLQDEIQDINDALSSSYAVPGGFDEAEFEKEFAQLEEEVSMEKLVGGPGSGGGPSGALPAYLDPAPTIPAASSKHPVAEATAEK